MRRLPPVLLLVLATAIATAAEEPWRPALRNMPLGVDAGSLSRTNCFPALLAAFQSNHLVKAFVVLPGASDDFYLLNRNQPLRLAATNLADLLGELERTTAIRVSWREPLLLLHTAKDKLKPETISLTSSVTKRLRTKSSVPTVMLVDRHWNTLQPWLATALGVKVTPEADSIDGWHFTRHNLAACGTTDWDLLGALSLAGGTRITIRSDQLQFEQRGAPPKRRPFIPPASF